MNRETFDDETLMAFADGELDESTTAKVEAALETDEGLAERLAVFFDTRRALASELQPLIHEPVPDALLASVRKMSEAAENGVPSALSTDENVVAFRTRNPAPQASRPRANWMMPIAASVLVTLAAGAGFLFGQGGVARTASLESEIAGLLDRGVSGEDLALDDNSVLHVISSFRDGTGALCREYEVRQADENSARVSCRSADGWATRLVLVSPRAEGYMPASAQETIDAYLTSIQAGVPLSTEEEQQALSQRD